MKRSLSYCIILQKEARHKHTASTLTLKTMTTKEAIVLRAFPSCVQMFPIENIPAKNPISMLPRKSASRWTVGWYQRPRNSPWVNTLFWSGSPDEAKFGSVEKVDCSSFQVPMQSWIIWMRPWMLRGTLTLSSG